MSVCFVRFSFPVSTLSWPNKLLYTLHLFALTVGIPVLASFLLYGTNSLP